MRSLPVRSVSSRRSTKALPAEGRPGPSDDDDDDDDGVYLKAVNINLRANLQIIKSVNLKYL